MKTESLKKQKAEQGLHQKLMASEIVDKILMTENNTDEISPSCYRENSP